MAMTIARLHKQLTALMEKGHGRKRVCIDKATFTDPLEDDGVTVMNVTDATEMTINVADGDGWTATNADGSEKTRKVLVLGGGHLREVPNADTLEDHPETLAATKDAQRYRLLRRGQHWSVINGIGDTLRADQLDAAIDAELATHNVEFSGTPAALSPEAPSRLPGSGTGDK